MVAARHTCCTDALRSVFVCTLGSWGCLNFHLLPGFFSPIVPFHWYSSSCIAAFNIQVRIPVSKGIVLWLCDFENGPPAGVLPQLVRSYFNFGLYPGQCHHLSATPVSLLPVCHRFWGLTMGLSPNLVRSILFHISVSTIRSTWVSCGHTYFSWICRSLYDTISDSRSWISYSSLESRYIWFQVILHSLGVTACHTSPYVFR